MSEKIPVLEQPHGDNPLEACLGWVNDEAEACALLLTTAWVREGIDRPGIGKLVFGGVLTGHIRVATDNGPYRDANGLYRWQPCLYPFFDTVENAGKPTPLDNAYIYKPVSDN